MKRVCFIVFSAFALVLSGCGHVSKQEATPPMSPSAPVRRPPSTPAANMTQSNKPLEERLRILRPFALKNMPSLWARIQSRRSEVEYQTALVNQMREQLISLGRRPEAEPGYIKLCNERDKIAKNLEELCVSLEQAYVNAKMYENSMGSRRMEQLEKGEYKDGLDDAKMLQMQYDQMLKEK